MSSADEPNAQAPSDAPVRRRDLAVARSLDSARVRSEGRVQRFLDAGFELLASAESGRDFTVQEVVDRSGQSLRSFYQYFDGKYELLLALFEESVRSTADQLREQIDEQGDPFERLHLFTVEYYRRCSPAPKTSGKRIPVSALGEFAQQLLTDHPKEAARAFVPLVSLYVELLDDAAAAGSLRAGLDHGRIAGVVLQAIMFNYFSATISGSSKGDDEADTTDAAEQLWDVLVRGIGTAPA